MTNDKIYVPNDSDNTILFESAVNLTQQEVDRILTSAPLPVREYMRHLSLSHGKFLRAKCLLACALKENGTVHRNAVLLASAIEILHLATLVHDDIIDNASIRRGSLTLQKKFGKKTAVICGDYLFCAALKQSGAISERDYYLNLGINLPDYMSRICLGELNQHTNNNNLDLTVFQYLKIISGKTAALFEASFFAGAVISEEKDKLSKYQRLGYNIGMIFQLRDDCIDFEFTQAQAKKPVQSDFEQGVITLPLIHTLKTLPAFKEKIKTGIVSRDEINLAVSKSGGLSFTRLISKKYFDKSIAALNELSLFEQKNTLLLSILEKAYKC